MTAPPCPKSLGSPATPAAIGSLSAVAPLARVRRHTQSGLARLYQPSEGYQRRDTADGGEQKPSETGGPRRGRHVRPTRWSGGRLLYQDRSSETDVEQALVDCLLFHPAQRRSRRGCSVWPGLSPA